MLKSDWFETAELTVPYFNLTARQVQVADILAADDFDLGLVFDIEDESLKTGIAGCEEYGKLFDNIVVCFIF